MSIISKIPMAVKIGAGAGVGGLAIGTLLTAKTTPSSVQKAEAREQWQEQFDGFTSKHPIPDGTAVSVTGNGRTFAASMVAAGGVGLAGAGAAMVTQLPLTGNLKLALIGVAAAGLGATAGAIAGYKLAT